ncbi:hypothetical protein pb186bvf_005187 [Paramecium bursaria]
MKGYIPPFLFPPYQKQCEIWNNLINIKLTMLIQDENGYNQMSSEKDCYRQQSSISRLVFTWLNKFVDHISHQEIENHDLFEIRDDEKAQNLYRSFEAHCFNTFQDQINSKNFFKVMFYAYKREWIVLFVLKLLMMACGMVNPIVVANITALFMEHRINQIEFVKSLGIFFSWIIALYVLVSVQYFYQNWLQYKFQNSLIAKCYNKIFQSNLPLVHNGELINIIQIDIPIIIQINASIIQAILIPFQLCGSIAIYYSMVGDPAIIGVIGVLLQLIIGAKYGQLYSAFQQNIQNARDERYQNIDEMLYGINTIKQNCYYKFFYERIRQSRNNEMESIKSQQILKFVMSFIMGIIPIFVLFTTFKVYNIFSLKSILVINQNYGTLVSIIFQIPQLISNLLLSQTSISRLIRFLKIKEQTLNLSNYQIEDAVLINNQTFEWHEQNTIEGNQTVENSQFKLFNISMKVQKGQKVLIVGPNGSGKTSLVYALMDELKNADKIHINGSINVSEQEPWIRQGTIQENILMDQELILDRYIEVLKVSQILQDILQMAGGHNTIIGEKGCSLSGGQKKRIHMARALYLKKDILVMDDPLTSLDQVTQKLFIESLSKYDTNQTKIITSNNMKYFDKFDRVIILYNGQITFDGPYQQAYSKYKQGDQQDEVDQSLFYNNTHQKLMEKLTPNEIYQKINKKFTNDLLSEDRIYGKVKTFVFVSLYQFFGRCWTFTFISFMSFIGMCLGLFYQIRLSQITTISDNKEATEAQKQDAQEQYLLLYPVTTLGIQLATLIAGIFLVNKSIHASKTLHANIIENLLQASVQYFYNIIQKSRITNRLTNDIYQFDMNTASQISAIVQYFFQLLSMFIACAALSSTFTYPVLVIFFFFQIKYTLKFVRLSVEIHRLQSLSKTPILNTLQETRQGILTLKNCYEKDNQINKFYELLDQSQKTNICMTSISNLYFDVRLNEQSAIISVFLSVQLAEYFQTLTLNIQQFYSSSIYFERCLSLIHNVVRESKINTNEIYSNMSIREQIQTINPRGEANFSSMELATINSDIGENVDSNALKIQNMYVQYGTDSIPIIKNFSLTQNKGQKIAIIGRTGSGKTTIIQCITRLIEPSQGDITLFGNKYSNYGINKIRQQFSVMAQDCFIFQGTLQQNIDPNKNYSNNQIQDILVSYNLHEMELFSDLNLKIEPYGQNLSLGQKQLIQLLRIILQNRKFVILDECTSNLDQQNFAQLNVVLYQYLKNKTVIAITHQLQQTYMFDQVVLISDGQTQFQGPPDQLFQQK